jgi:hypothetical protein
VTRRTAARVLALVCTCVLASVLAVALLGLAGCGGGGDSDADLDEPLAGACYVAGQLTAQQACTPDRHLPTLPSADASR